MVRGGLEPDFLFHVAPLFDKSPSGWLIRDHGFDV
jgi:hypothetical protein